MAAIVGAAASEIETLIAALAGGGTGGLIGRIGASALGGLAASEVLNLLKGKPTTTKAHVPKFALVDLHNDVIITGLSTRRAYRFLIRPRRRASRSRPTKIISVSPGGGITEVR